MASRDMRIRQLIDGFNKSYPNKLTFDVESVPSSISPEKLATFLNSFAVDDLATSIANSAAKYFTRLEPLSRKREIVKKWSTALTLLYYELPGLEKIVANKMEPTKEDEFLMDIPFRGAEFKAFLTQFDINLLSHIHTKVQGVYLTENFPSLYDIHVYVRGAFKYHILRSNPKLEENERNIHAKRIKEIVRFYRSNVDVDLKGFVNRIDSFEKDSLNVNYIKFLNEIKIPYLMKLDRTCHFRINNEILFYQLAIFYRTYLDTRSVPTIEELVYTITSHPQYIEQSKHRKIKTKKKKINQLDVKVKSLTLDL
ncbi:uncharacterized protein RJT21DRAFT_42807 [Scheffersomyces amazonensis]|uniref:uncharacterized protein n=1 Tax=Scheffersomyces amazonensis TaxID=1078765 RepID=UPI00315C88ED